MTRSIASTGTAISSAREAAIRLYGRRCATGRGVTERLVRRGRSSARPLPLLLLAVACLLPWSLPLAAVERRVALVVGNAGYADMPLRNPLNDARDIATLLRERLGFATMLHLDVDRHGMHRAIREFGEASKGADVRLFYFAGHGISVDGANYLVPVGADLEHEDEVKVTTIDASAVLAKMESAGRGTNLIILDACRNNPLSRSGRTAMRGLSRMIAPTGSLIFYATGPGKVAQDGLGRNGTFTKHLLSNLAKPGNDLQDVVIDVRVGVMNETADEQVPWSESSLTRRVYLAGREAGQLALPEVPGGGLDDDVDRSNGPFDFLVAAADVDAVRSRKCAHDDTARGDELKREASAVFHGRYQHSGRRDEEAGWQLFMEAIERCSAAAMVEIAQMLLRKKECALAIEYAQLAADHGYAVASRLVNQIRRKPARACNG